MWNVIQSIFWLPQNNFASEEMFLCFFDFLYPIFSTSEAAVWTTGNCMMGNVSYAANLMTVTYEKAIFSVQPHFSY